VGALKNIVLSALMLLTVMSAAVADDPAKLSRVRGDVSYALGADLGKRTALFGSIVLSGDASAITAFKAQAEVTLPDSSLVQIGDRTTVKLGAFRAAENGATEIVLEHGALRFTIKHPAGEKSLYRFRTPTTQLAVRGTVAYLISGPGGDQIYCVDCPSGDVSVRAGTLGEYPVESGQTLNVQGRRRRVVDARIIANRTVNNPAIDQFLSGVSPFGEPAATGHDFTGSNSGAER
jgi:hypothetical protein